MSFSWKKVKDYQDIIYEKMDGIAKITINRPEKRNAINRQMLLELITFLDIHAESTQFRVLVISGTDGFFSAGADLEWMKQASEQTYKENLEDARSIPNSGISLSQLSFV